MNYKKNTIITILGPTASGKTAVAACLAFRLSGEVISADSRQVYRHMDLGTGKDYDDYVVDGTKIPFHLIDIKQPGEKYNLFEYQQDFFKAYAQIIERDKVPVLCGGTGLYIEAATKAYKMMAVPPNDMLREELKAKSIEELAEILQQYRKLHNLSDFDTKKRAIRAIEIEMFQHQNKEQINYPQLKAVYIGVKFDRASQRKRITDRLKQRLECGMLEEVQELLNRGIATEDLIYYGLEYKYLTLHLIGELSYEEMFQKLNTAIHQFAKRQMTWYRRMERNGDKIHWLDGYESLNSKIERVLEILNNYELKKV